MWPCEAAPHIGIFVRNLSSAMAAEGLDVEAVALIEGRRPGWLTKTRVHARLGIDLARSAIKPADILYVHAPSWFADLSALTARPHAKRLVVHMHGGEVYPHSKVESLAQGAVAKLCRRADLVVSPSKYYAQQAIEAFGLDAGRVFVSPSGGVDTTLFSPGDQASARKALNLPLAPRFLGLFGRIEDDKGWDVFVDVLARLRAEGRDVRGLIVGNGGGLAAMQASARRQDVPLEIRGLMPQSKLRLAYRALDVFLFPTRRGAEALGLVPIEAMASGIPVVASNRYAVPEYVEDGVTGHMVAPRDVRGFSTAVARILDLLPSEQSDMRDAARNAAHRFDAGRSAQALVERLHQIVDRPC